MQLEVHKVFFQLLQAGLWQKPCALTYFPISEEAWNAIYQIAKQHTVDAIICEGILSLPSQYFPQKKLLLQWVIRQDKIIARNKYVNETIEKQLFFFNKENLHPILLKGQSVALYYANPLLRLSGDVDWYFEKKEDFEAANSCIKSLGVSLNFDTDYSVNYMWNNQEFEHHQKLFDLHNPFCKTYLKNLTKKYKPYQEKIAFGSEEANTLAPILQIVQINTHILKHLLSYGIGLRQLCDAARAYAYYKDRLDGKELLLIYKKLGIQKWITLLHQVLIDYIGLPKEYLPYESNTSQTNNIILEDVMRGGNFGFFDTNFTGSANQRHKKYKKIWNSFKTYYPYAPLEALFFPIFHYLSRLNRNA